MRLSPNSKAEEKQDKAKRKLSSKSLGKEALIDPNSRNQKLEQYINNIDAQGKQRSNALMTGQRLRNDDSERSCFHKGLLFKKKDASLDTKLNEEKNEVNFQKLREEERSKMKNKISKTNYQKKFKQFQQVKGLLNYQQLQEMERVKALYQSLRKQHLSKLKKRNQEDCKIIEERDQEDQRIRIERQDQIQKILSQRKQEDEKIALKRKKQDEDNENKRKKQDDYMDQKWKNEDKTRQYYRNVKDKKINKQRLQIDLNDEKAKDLWKLQMTELQTLIENVKDEKTITRAKEIRKINRNRWNKGGYRKEKEKNEGGNVVQVGGQAVQVGGQAEGEVAVQVGGQAEGEVAVQVGGQAEGGVAVQVGGQAEGGVAVQVGGQAEGEVAVQVGDHPDPSLNL